jgi:PST family polysaccharide transporter
VSGDAHAQGEHGGSDALPAAGGPTPTEPGIDKYKKRAVLGGVALAVRTGLAQLIILGGTVVLARYLRPAEFGAFAMVQFVLTVLTIFGDAGLGGALIQKKSAPTERELSSVFFAQMAMALAVLALASLVAEALPHVFPDLPEGSPWILRALALAFVFVSARVVPTLLMERELLFVRVAILDTINSVTFYLFASILAVAGFGIWALVLGVLAQGALGWLAALALRPWRPRLEFDLEIVRGLLGFGVPFQARSIFVLGTRAVIPVAAGTMIGSEAVGFLNWSLETAFFPLTFVDIIARVSFPLYSRLQSAPADFAQALERSVRMAVTIALGLGAIFLGLSRALTEIIYSAQWLPAVTMLEIFALVITVGILVNVLTPAFDAIGKPRIVLAQMAVVLALTWTAAPLGARLAGSDGFAAGYALAMAVGALVILVLARRELPRVAIGRAYLAPAVGAGLSVGLGRLALAPLVEGPVSLALAVVALVVAFLLVVALLDRTTFDALRAMLPGAPRPEAGAKAS